MKNTLSPDTLKNLRQAIGDGDISMTSLLSEDCGVETFPLPTAHLDATGHVWFFVSKDTARKQYMKEEAVYLLYAHPLKRVSVNIIGHCSLVYDKKKMQEMWKPFMKWWYPQGVEGNDLCLLKVSVKDVCWWLNRNDSNDGFKNLFKVITEVEQPQDDEKYLLAS
ncbi:MAG: pyridoxamine 5'-phosphate oxidase family protein [Filimonas sp.]|nr:pyridoxamine 5'-phosphate oxidase family protein [Filimonas sp.]